MRLQSCTPQFHSLHRCVGYRSRRRPFRDQAIADLVPAGHHRKCESTDGNWKMTMIRKAACLLVALAFLPAAQLRPGEPNPDGFLPSDPSGIDQTDADRSLKGKGAFLNDAVWDERFQIAAACGLESSDWMNNAANMLMTRMAWTMKSIPWPTPRDFDIEEFRFGGGIVATIQVGKGLGQRVGAETFCPLVFSEQNLHWMTDAIAKDLDQPYDGISFENYPFGRSRPADWAEEAEIAVRCGIRDRAWQKRVLDGERRQDIPASGDWTVAQKDAAYRDGYLAASLKWADWESTQVPEGGCSTLDPKVVAVDDGVAGSSSTAK